MCESSKAPFLELESRLIAIVNPEAQQTLERGELMLRRHSVLARFFAKLRAARARNASKEKVGPGAAQDFRLSPQVAQLQC
jgi:hypothetical protein